MKLWRLLVVAVLLGSAAGVVADEQAAPDASPPAATKKIAALVTVYTPMSHADVIVSRLLPGNPMRGPGEEYHLELAALYVDQTSERDMSRALAEEHGFILAQSVEQALTLGSGALAVDGVLLIAEHGDYPKSELGSTQYPKRQLFEAIAVVFEKSGRVVPVYIDKHVEDDWQDIAWIYEKAQALGVPVMAGSSVPLAWREPEADVDGDAKLEQIVAISYHTLDGYGFHAVEAVQALAEQRQGGETGIASVQTITGDDVWNIEDAGCDRALFDAALAAQPRLRTRNRTLQEAVRNPALFIIRYQDGLVAYIFTLQGAVAHWSAAWKYADERTAATYFVLPERKPFPHFALLDQAIAQMMHSGKPTYPVERTVLSSGALDALLQSKQQGGAVIDTPHLLVNYQSNWRWQQPPPPAPEDAPDAQ